MHTTHKHPHTSTGRKLMRYIRKLGRSVQILYMIFTTVTVSTSYPWTRDGRYDTRIIDTTDTDTDSIDTWFLASSIRYLIKLTWCIVAAIDQVTSNPRIWTWFSRYNTRTVLLSIFFLLLCTDFNFPWKGEGENFIVSYQYTMQILSIALWIISCWYHPLLYHEQGSSHSSLPLMDTPISKC